MFSNTVELRSHLIIFFSKFDIQKYCFGIIILQVRVLHFVIEYSKNDFLKFSNYYIVGPFFPEAIPDELFVHRVSYGYFDI